MLRSCNDCLTHVLVFLSMRSCLVMLLAAFFLLACLYCVMTHIHMSKCGRRNFGPASAPHGPPGFGFDELQSFSGKRADVLHLRRRISGTCPRRTLDIGSVVSVHELVNISTTTSDLTGRCDARYSACTVCDVLKMGLVFEHYGRRKTLFST